MTHGFVHHYLPTALEESGLLPAKVLLPRPVLRGSGAVAAGFFQTFKTVLEDPEVLG